MAEPLAIEATDHHPLIISNHSRKENKPFLFVFTSIIVVLLAIIIFLSVTGSNQSWPFKGDSKQSNKYKDTFGSMWAPFTPFMDDSTSYSVPTFNHTAIPFLAATGDKYGADILFIGGSNAQFDTMTVEERKLLISSWVNVTIENNYNFYLIFQLCSTKLFESVELAEYAAELHSLYGKPDAIGSLPPFYEKPSTTDQFDQLFRWFRPIVNAANGIPFWYYHLPSQTMVDLNMRDLVYYSYNGNDKGTSLPELKGTKYVSSTGYDIFETTRLYSDDDNGGLYGGFNMIVWSNPAMSFTAYDQIAGFGQDYYWIPVTKCILKAVENGDIDKAYEYQEWRYSMNSLLGNVVQRRCLHQKISGFDMGPPRQPLLPIDQNICTSMILQLEEVGFFDDIEDMIKDCN